MVRSSRFWVGIFSSEKRFFATVYLHKTITNFKKSKQLKLWNTFPITNREEHTNDRFCFATVLLIITCTTIREILQADHAAANYRFEFYFESSDCFPPKTITRDTRRSPLKCEQPKQTNERTNERTNKQTNKQTNKRTNKQKNKQTNEWTKGDSPPL
jgi:hypothetical protein